MSITYFKLFNNYYKNEVNTMYEKIRNLRENKDLTQKQIGIILNMSQTGYNQYETEKNNIPTRVLIELAKFYNTSTDYILGLTDEIRPYKRKEEK